MKIQFEKQQNILLQLFVMLFVASTHG